MKYLKSAILVYSIILSLNANRSFAQTNLFAPGKYISAKGDTLNYRLFTPDRNPLRKYPLIIFLHGSGERGNDNESQLKFGVTHFADDRISSMYPAFVIAPQCPADMRWANISDHRSKTDVRLGEPPSRPMELLIELIWKVRKEFPVDTNRIYITGLSMGGHGTYDAIERYPQLFAAAVPVSGAGDTTRAASIAHIPMWIFHGAEDPTVSHLYSLNMVTALTRAGAHPGLTVFPEGGHFISKGVYTSLEMFAWLFRQHK